jgi:hypothetical protein
VTTVTPDGSVNRHSKLDTAQFKTAFGDFHIYNRPGMLVADVVSHTPFPAHLETRVVESLSFVLAKPLRIRSRITSRFLRIGGWRGSSTWAGGRRTQSSSSP